MCVRTDLNSFVRSCIEETAIVSVSVVECLDPQTVVDGAGATQRVKRKVVLFVLSVLLVVVWIPLPIRRLGSSTILEDY
jgi:hypothetical protein